MKNFINDFIEQNEIITSFLDKTGRRYENSDKNLVLFKDFLIQTKYNAALGNDLANFLQCLNDEENFSDFQLRDISRLYDSLLKLQEFNIDSYLDAGHFEFAIMDNKQKAIQTIKKGLDKGTQKIEELKLLLKTIENEV
jgi:hypothetical protein